MRPAWAVNNNKKGENGNVLLRYQQGTEIFKVQALRQFRGHD